MLYCGSSSVLWSHETPCCEYLRNSLHQFAGFEDSQGSIRGRPWEELVVEWLSRLHLSKQDSHARKLEDWASYYVRLSRRFGPTHPESTLPAEYDCKTLCATSTARWTRRRRTISWKFVISFNRSLAPLARQSQRNDRQHVREFIVARREGTVQYRVNRQSSANPRLS